MCVFDVPVKVDSCHKSWIAKWDVKALYGEERENSLFSAETLHNTSNTDGGSPEQLHRREVVR